MTQEKDVGHHHATDAHTSKTPAAIVAQSSENDKSFATLRAELALAGFAIRACAGGGWFVASDSAAFFARDWDDLALLAAEVRR